MYATFHQWDKENHRSSCNGGIFRVFRVGGLMKSTEDEGISTIPTVKF